MCFFFQQKFTRFCFFVFFSFLRLKLHFSQNSISLQRVKSKIVFYTAFLCRFILWLLSQQLLINLANSVSLYHFAEHLGHDRREAKTTIRHPNILLGCLALTDLMVGLVVQPLRVTMTIPSTWRGLSQILLHPLSI